MFRHYIIYIYIFIIFALFWMLYSCFCLIPRRLNFIYRRFGTHCPVFTGRVDKNTTCEDGTECSETSAYKIQTLGITQKQEYNTKIFPVYAKKAYEGVELWLYPFLTVARGGGDWPALRTARSAAGCWDTNTCWMGGQEYCDVTTVLN
jgi:hypothetical protein